MKNMRKGDVKKNLIKFTVFMVLISVIIFNPTNFIFNQENSQNTKTTYAANKETIKTGIRTIDGKKYYFSAKTKKAVTGMVTIGNDRYYFKYGGGLYKGFKTINNKLYYFTSKTGKAAKGITKVGKYKYYFHPTYSYAVSGLHSIWKKVYYFNPKTYRMMKNNSVKIGYLVFKSNKNGLVKSVKAAKGYENNKRAKALINGFKLIGTPYGNDEGLLMCNRFAATVLLSVGNNELVTQSNYSGKTFFKPVEVQAEYVLQQGYNKNITGKNLRPGDLIYWDYGRNSSKGKHIKYNGKDYYIGHVSVYLGKNQMMEATGSVWDGGRGYTRVTSFDYKNAKKTYYPRIYASILP